MYKRQEEEDARAAMPLQILSVTLGVSFFTEAEMHMETVTGNPRADGGGAIADGKKRRREGACVL